MNMYLATLKIIADYYPAQLHKAFVIDPPSLFSYLWKVYILLYTYLPTLLFFSLPHFYFEFILIICVQYAAMD